MWYGCEFSVTSDCVVLSSELVTTGQFDEASANEALHAMYAYSDSEINESVGFAVVYFDESSFEISRLLLDKKFLNDESIEKIGDSLTMLYTN